MTIPTMSQIEAKKAAIARLKPRSQRRAIVERELRDLVTKALRGGQRIKRRVVE